MSGSAERDKGTYGETAAYLPEGDPQGPPNVYHPRPEVPPGYEGYADPASAHGWAGNAYDETTQLPPVVDEGPRDEARLADRSRHRRGGRRTPRAAVVAGAIAAVSLAAVIAGFSFSGASSDGPEGKERHTGPTAEDSAPSAPASSAETSASARLPSGAGEPASTAPTSTAPTTTTPRTSTSTPPTPSPSATSSAPGRGNSGAAPGRTHGGGKKP